jgi:hypothetical protein
VPLSIATTRRSNCKHRVCLLRPHGEYGAHDKRLLCHSRRFGEEGRVLNEKIWFKGGIDVNQ